MTLTKDNLLEAIQKCFSNAESLISDATLLKQNDRKERSYSLFQLASEEAGKAIRIFDFLLLEDISDSKARKQFLKDFLNHKEKTKNSIGMDYFVLLFAKKAIKDKLKFLEASLYESENVDKINNLKNHSLYTSIHENKFKTPSEIISQNDLINIEFRTITRFNAAKSFINFQIKNIDLLRDYLKTNPINLSDDAAVKYLWEQLE